MNNQTVPYQPADHWKVKDKAWLAERKAKWQRIAAYYKRRGKPATEIRLYEQYFVKGNLKYSDGRAYGGIKQPDLNLAQQLIWHPSRDEYVWWQIVAMNDQNFDVYGYGYDFLSFEGKAVLPIIFDSPDLDSRVFAGGEAELFQFFFRNPAWHAHMQKKAAVAEQKKAERLRAQGRPKSTSTENPLLTMQHHRIVLQGDLLSAVYYLDINATDIIILYDALPFYFLPYLHETYISEYYAERISDPDNFSRLRERLGRLANLHTGCQQRPLQQRLFIEAYAEQLEKSAPEWQALWTELKQEAQARLEQVVVQTLEASISEESPEETDMGDTKTTEPWSAELLQLKSKLHSMGFAVNNSKADVAELLLDAFHYQSIPFDFIVLGRMELDAEDFERPYPAFTKPLDTLCELKGGQKLSYRRRGERVTINVNEQTIGVIDLEEPEEEEAVAYFASVLKLANEWFPGQVFCYGDETLLMFILPEDLVRWLEGNGFENSLNYFGSAD